MHINNTIVTSIHDRYYGQCTPTIIIPNYFPTCSKVFFRFTKFLCYGVNILFIRTLAKNRYIWVGWRRNNYAWKEVRIRCLAAIKFHTQIRFLRYVTLSKNWIFFLKGQYFCKYCRKPCQNYWVRLSVLPNISRKVSCITSYRFL